MGDFLHKCRICVDRALDRIFFGNVANIVLVVVAILLLISMMIHPALLVALALLGLFIWLVLCC
jgi:hypothetical protein